MNTNTCTSTCCLQAFKVARVMAPSVIYIDEIETVIHKLYTCICWTLICCQALLIEREEACHHICLVLVDQTFAESLLLKTYPS